MTTNQAFFIGAFFGVMLANVVHLTLTLYLDRRRRKRRHPDLCPHGNNWDCCPVCSH